MPPCSVVSFSATVGILNPLYGRGGGGALTCYSTDDRMSRSKNKTVFVSVLIEIFYNRKDFDLIACVLFVSV